MDFLLDTNILLWSQLSPRKLSATVQRHLKDPYNRVYYSPINIWEIAIKYSRGKLSLGGRTPDQFFDAIDSENQFDCLELLPGSLATSYQLPLRHTDAFDRILIWEAVQHDLIFLSSDKALQAYEQDGLRLVT
ncbi:MAG: type II toxin-antitoxin system VapC family toxin [Coriobacteriia bacterium]|nr:type II toxin-antitoxin system VapC family toxin [Coriobacteriia bacterium]